MTTTQLATIQQFVDLYCPDGFQSCASCRHHGVTPLRNMVCLHALHPENEKRPQAHDDRIECEKGPGIA